MNPERIINDIDRVLLEESETLDELKRIVDQNGTEVSYEQLVFGWFHDSHLDEGEING